MCGLSFSKIKYSNRSIDLKKKIIKINALLVSKQSDLLLAEVRSLKCNQVFFEIVIKENNFIISELKNLIIKFKYIDSIKQKKIDLVDDLTWIIESEIFFKSSRIKKFANKNNIKINKKSIIFIRYFLYSLESMNYLESRGRDSLGISINLVSSTLLNIKKTEIKNNKNINIFKNKINKNKYFTNITIKYAKRIGYSGDNTQKILKLISTKKLFSKLDFSNLISTDLIAHTRWASVGDVNLSNTHPLIEKKNNLINLSFMNGDINNYNLLKKKLINEKKFILSDKKCTNDLQPISSLILHKYKRINDILNGSYVLINFNSQNFNKIDIYKKGSQGIYYTLDSDDNFHVASDVYGLINKSNKFEKLIEDGKFSINTEFINKLKKKKFSNTELMTNDLSKKGFNRFFLKEVNDTEIFLKRTINNYLDFKKSIFTNMDDIINSTTINHFKKKRIKNIIFTGMGSCYSAAVGISKYLSERLNSIGFKDIKIEATIASEGSGFYLSDNMTDTIIVVIAQSGTTIDTNIFAKMAKERGAYTLALVNKKQGDVTYIVDKSLYLGNGRDVEMSVPSTKTYTCHLIMGFMLSEKIIGILKKKINLNFLKTTKELVNSKFIENTLNDKKECIDKINIDVLKYKNWIVIYDDSKNSFSALELRIKLSECCYKSIPYFHINSFNKMSLKNSLIFYLGTNKPQLKKIDSTNHYVFIGKNITKKKNITTISLKSDNLIKLAIESSLSIQLLSYKISEIIDKFSESIKKNNKEVKFISEFIIDKKNLAKFRLLSFKKKKILLSDKLKRPIDAIKHQAKTVTVGAIRGDNEKNIPVYENQENYVSTDIDTTFKNNFSILKNNINIFGDENIDSEKYFFGNLIEYYNSKYKKNLHYKFYNKTFNTKKLNKNSNIIFEKTRNNIFLNNKSIFHEKIIDSHNLIKEFLPEDKFSIHSEVIFNKAKKIMLENNFYYELNLKNLFNKFNNIKFLGSGINYLVAKKYAQIFSKKFNKAIAFDVIENHKHIDISSEPLILIFAANINRHGFQNDIYSEVEKFIAHENEPIIFTNTGNNIYDQLLLRNEYSKKRVIKLPPVEEIYSLSIFDFYFENFIF